MSRQSRVDGLPSWPVRFPKNRNRRSDYGDKFASEMTAYLARRIWNVLTCLSGLCLVTGFSGAASDYDAFVDAAFADPDGSMVDGKPTFRSIGAAISAVPLANEHPFRILIRKGFYEEKLLIDRPNVALIGEDRDKTVISHDDSGDSLGPDGVPLGTWGSYTIKIVAPDFRAENLTIENRFDYPGNAAKSDDDSTKIANPQAVALMTDTGSDRAVFKNCLIRGYQDTLFVNAGRHFFENCTITGHVDFIFGAGIAVFSRCNIVSRPRANKNPTGYVTAPSTLASEPFGLVFDRSRFIKESHEVIPGSVRLGRPWHPNARMDVNGSAVFIDCYMDDHIGAEGYAPISSRNADGDRIWFEVGPDSRFFEWATSGPGAHVNDRRPQLPPSELPRFRLDSVLRDWQP